MKKTEIIIRSIFLFIIFALFLFQLLIFLDVAQLSSGGHMQTFRVFMWTCGVYILFLIYTGLIALLFKTSMEEISKIYLICSLVITTVLIGVSLLIL